MSSREKALPPPPPSPSDRPVTRGSTSSSLDWTHQNPHHHGETPTLLAQEKEIDGLQRENRSLRREVHSLRTQATPLQHTIDQTRKYLKQRDDLMSQLARDIRRSLEVYQTNLDALREEALGSNGPEATYLRLIAELENDLSDLPRFSSG